MKGYIGVIVAETALWRDKFPVVLPLFINKLLKGTF